MVYDLAKAYEASDNKENFRPECKTHKKHSGAIRTPKFVADVVEIVNENSSKKKQRKSPRKWAPVGEQSGVLSRRT